MSATPSLLRHAHTRTHACLRPPAPAGIEYLRAYLHLPTETVPHTHKKPARPAGLPERGGERRGFGDREGRPRFGDKEKGTGAPGEFRPRFGGEGEYRRRSERPAAAGAPA